MRVFIFTLVLLVITSAGSAAEREVKVDVRIISVPIEAAVGLSRKFQRPDTIPEATTRLQELLAHGEAELLGWPMVRVITGEKSTSEAAEEIRYATEFEPPQFPREIGNRNPQWFQNALYLTYYYQPPSSFESRNCGPTLEVEAAKVEENTNTVKLTLRAAVTRLEAMEPAIGMHHPPRGQNPMWQPRFSVLRQDSVVNVGNGSVILLGRCLDAAPRRRMVFFLLHTVIKSPLP